MTKIGDITMPDGSAVSYDGALASGFRLSFPKVTWLTLFLQEANVPDVSVTEVSRPTRFADINEIGEKMKYGHFSCSFLVDKELKNYKEVFNWMRRMTVAGSVIDEIDNPILIVNNIEMFRFVGAWPMSISNLSFVANSTDATYLTATAVFNFDYMEFVSEPFHVTNNI